VSELKNTIQASDIEWTMEWGDKPPTVEFEAELALAHLLMNGVIFTNDHWWEKEAPQHLQKATGLFVNCSDVFAWGCADSDELPHDQIKPLYKLWAANPKWGPVKWACIHRDEQPQEPIKRDMKAEGYWDAELEVLPENSYWAALRVKVQGAA
jgi:hypothetical protein